MTNIEQAISIAVEMHAGQVDKSGQPYILHPLRVMRAVEGETDMIVAVLHDVVEDCGFGLGIIRGKFGEEIYAAIKALTRYEGESYEEFILRCKANSIARRVKIADVRDNMRPGAEHLLPRYEKALAVLEEEPTT